VWKCGAYWLLLDAEVRLTRTEYNPALAAERIRMTAYRQPYEFESGSVLQPPSEEKMLEPFAAAELK